MVEIDKIVKVSEEAQTDKEKFLNVASII